MNFCPKCGKETELIEGLCKSCFIKTTDIITLKNNFVKCSPCSKWLSKGQWKGIKEAIKDSIKYKGEMENLSIDDDYNIEYSIKYKQTLFSGRIKLKPIISKRTCKQCSRRSGGYYEAIIQLRGNWEIPYEYSKWIDASKVEQKKEGTDIYVIDFFDANKLASMLKKRFGAEKKESMSMAGMKDGKSMNRKTIMLRFR